MIVTIDGPSGAGKSTTARRLAGEIGYRFLDTGAMYRALAWNVLQSGTTFDDLPTVIAIARKTRLEIDQELITVNGREVSSLLRTPEVSQASSAIAQIQEIRQLMVLAQRRIGANGDYVCEGRDQGTVVFPDAICKFFLTASPECRARRRSEELRARGTDISFEEILRQQIERDHRDSTRQSSPLVPAHDAIQIDTTGMSLDEVLDRMKHDVLAKVELLLEQGRKGE